MSVVSEVGQKKKLDMQKGKKLSDAEMNGGHINKQGTKKLENCGKDVTVWENKVNKSSSVDEVDGRLPEGDSTLHKTHNGNNNKGVPNPKMGRGSVFIDGTNVLEEFDKKISVFNQVRDVISNTVMMVNESLNKTENEKICELQFDQVKKEIRKDKKIKVQESINDAAWDKKYVDLISPLNQIIAEDLRKRTVLWTLISFDDCPGQWFPAIIDTGACRSCIGRPMVDQGKFKEVEIEKRKFNGIGGATEIGKTVEPYMRFRKDDQTILRGWVSFVVLEINEPLILIGSDILSAFKMSINFVPEPYHPFMVPLEFPDRCIPCSATSEMNSPHLTQTVVGNIMLAVEGVCDLTESFKLKATSNLTHIYQNYIMKVTGDTWVDPVERIYDRSSQPDKPTKVLESVTVVDEYMKSCGEITESQFKEIEASVGKLSDITLSLDHSFEKLLRSEDLKIDPSRNNLVKWILVQILRKNQEAFSYENHEIGHFDAVKYEIKLIRPLPPPGKMRWHSPRDNETMAAANAPLLKAGRIVKASNRVHLNVGQYAISEEHIVKIEGKDDRVVIDYNPINAYIATDPYPGNKVSQVLDWVGRTPFTVCSDFDATKMFWNLYIEDLRTRAILMFRGEQGNIYEPHYCPLGPKTVPAHCNRALDIVSGDMKWKSYCNFVDDAVLKEMMMYRHLIDLDDILGRFIKFGLRIKLSKSHWLFAMMEVLGYVATPNGFGPSEKKIEVVKNWTKPNNVAILWAHYGLGIFFASGIPRFSDRFATLQDEITRALNIYRTQSAARLKKLKERRQDSTAPAAELLVNTTAKPRITTSEKVKIPGGPINNYQNAYEEYTDWDGDLPLGKKKIRDKLCKKAMEKSIIKWTPEMEKAWEELKYTLISEPGPVLASPRDGMSFLLRVDTSKIATNMVLFQWQFGMVLKIVKCSSRRLTKTETNYAAGELEFTGLMRGLEHAAEFVDGCGQFAVETDHKALLWGQNYDGNNSRVKRLAIELQYWMPSIVISHKPGVLMDVADTCSRILYGCYTAFEIDENPSVLNEETFTNLLKKSLEEDVVTKKIIGILKKSENFCDRTKEENILVKGYTYKDGLLFFKIGKRHLNEGEIRIFIPNCRQLKVDCCIMAHDMRGHFGIKKTLLKIQEYFYWNKMTRFVVKYINGCIKCQESKVERDLPKGEMMFREIPMKRWSHVSMDICVSMPLTTRGNNAFVLYQDMFSGELRGKPIHTTIKSEEVAWIYIELVYSKEGAQDILFSDLGSVFMSNFMKSLCEVVGTIQTTTTAHNHSNPVERGIQTTLQIIRSVVNSSVLDDWDLYLSFVLFLINLAPNESRGNLSPFEINKGYIPKHGFLENYSRGRSASLEELVDRLDDIQIIVREELVEASEINKKHFDSNHKPENFEVNELVMLSTKNIAIFKSKIARKFFGPFKIIEKDNWNNYKLDFPTTYQRLHPWFHINKLQRYIVPMENQPNYSNPLPEIIDEVEEYVVENIVSHKCFGEKRHYRIRWKGYSPVDDTWEPEINLKHSMDLLIDYWNTVKLTAEFTIAKSKSLKKIADAHKLLQNYKLFADSIQIDQPGIVDAVAADLPVLEANDAVAGYPDDTDAVLDAHKKYVTRFGRTVTKPQRLAMVLQDSVSSGAMVNCKKNRVNGGWRSSGSEPFSKGGCQVLCVYTPDFPMHWSRSLATKNANRNNYIIT